LENKALRRSHFHGDGRKVICPTGTLSELLSSPRAKNISLPFFGNTGFALAILEQPRRRIAQIIKEQNVYLIGWRGYFGFCETPSGA
jgi:hypothetical protein